MELFGKKVRELRIEQHLSQEKLSAMCAVHRNFIGRVERAKTNIQFDRVMKIAGGLKVKPSVLFEYVAKPKPPEPLDEK